MNRRSKIPKPAILNRPIQLDVYKKAQALNLDLLVARILAGRSLPSDIDLKVWLQGTLQNIKSPKDMADLQKSTYRLAQAIKNGECIGIETDHDCDGQTSHAVIYKALTEFFKHPASLIRSYIGHRLKEGYGLSYALTQRILQDPVKPSLLITADNGSSDELRIAQLKAENIDVIVTDHHAIPSEGIPESAFAVLNPTRDDCEYGDPYIAGCMVAWLFMAWTRTYLIETQHLPKETPSLASLLDFVAVGTIADCVSLARSTTNRIVVRYGMKLLEQYQRPCWHALKRYLSPAITSEDVGFKIAPLLNSDGRLACAFGSLSLLLSESETEAQDWVQALMSTNHERKEIQKRLTEDSIRLALTQESLRKKSICIFLEEGHAGVHGITASRIKDLFGKPTFIFSAKLHEEDWLSGSGRSIDDCHLREALQWIYDHYPNVLEKFGGHRGAAGVTIKKTNFLMFSKAFEEAVHQQILHEPKPYLYSDGPLPPEYYDIQKIATLNKLLEPFGREFDPPVFELVGSVYGIQWMGEDKVHMRFFVRNTNQVYPCVWFHARERAQDPAAIEEGDWVRVLFVLRIDDFGNVPRLKCFVKHTEVVTQKAFAVS